MLRLVCGLLMLLGPLALLSTTSWDRGTNRVPVSTLVANTDPMLQFIVLSTLVVRFVSDHNAGSASTIARGHSTARGIAPGSLSRPGLVVLDELLP